MHISWDILYEGKHHHPSYFLSTCWYNNILGDHTVYPEKYAHGFVVLCFVVVMQSFIMNSHGVFIHIHRGCFAGTGAIVRLPQCQWSKPDGYGKISQCITTTKHNKAKTVCIFLGIYCRILVYLYPTKFQPSPIKDNFMSKEFIYNSKSSMCYGKLLIFWWNNDSLFVSILLIFLLKASSK